MNIMPSQPLGSSSNADHGTSIPPPQFTKPGPPTMNFVPSPPLEWPSRDVPSPPLERLSRDVGLADTGLPPHYKRRRQELIRRLFHVDHVRMKLNNAKSGEDFKNELKVLIENIFTISSYQEMEPCIVDAVRECFRMNKRRKELVSGIEPLLQFYEFQVHGNSLPAFIIFYARPNLHEETRVRHSLLELLLKELPLTVAVRDKIYLACAQMGFNCFFKKVRQASLKQLHGTASASVVSLEDELMPSALEDVIHVIPNIMVLDGFQVKWLIPNLGQRLQAGIPVGIDFVAQGHVWGLYLKILPDRPIQIHLCILKPSKYEGEARYRVSFLEKKDPLPFSWLLSSSSLVQSSTNWCRLSPTQGSSPMPSVVCSLENESSRGDATIRDGAYCLTLDVEWRFKDHAYCCYCDQCCNCQIRPECEPEPLSSDGHLSCTYCRENRKMTFKGSSLQDDGTSEKGSWEEDTIDKFENFAF